MINIIEKKECCGCSACVQACPKQCISFQSDSEGFFYPRVNEEHCINCGLCEKVCPILNVNEERKPKKVYAAWNEDESIRYSSSSGGVFTALAEEFINQGGVVFGAKFDSEWKVVHDYVDSIEGLSAFRGSKYVQSDIHDCYRKASVLLKKGVKVLFTGTPCQIAGLRHYLRNDYANLITLDVICHGVPSPMVWSDYLKNLQQRRGLLPLSPKKSYNSNNTYIEQVSFRDKLNGWKKYDFTINFTSNYNKTNKTDKIVASPFEKSVVFREESRRNVYMLGFLKCFYLRPSCHDCRFRCGKSGSDITLGDFWGIQHIKPELDDDKGISLVLANSKKGEDLIKLTNIKTYIANYDEAYYWNHALEQNPSIPPEREYFWNLYNKIGVKAIKGTLKKFQPSLLVRLRIIIKRYIEFLIR